MMNAYPHYPERKQAQLSGTCDFAFLENIDDPRTIDLKSIDFQETMTLPGCYDAMPAWAGKRGTGIYRKTFTATPGKKGVLKIHGLGMWNQIFIDRNPVGICDLPYGGMSFEVPPSTDRERELIIVNDSRFDEKRLPMQLQRYDFYAYGGVYRDIEFYEVEGAFLDRVAFRVDDLEAKRGTFRFYCKGDVPDTAACVMRIDSASIQKEFPLVLAGGEASVTVDLPELEIWDPETPALYEAISL